MPCPAHTLILNRLQHPPIPRPGKPAHIIIRVALLVLWVFGGGGVFSAVCLEVFLFDGGYAGGRRMSFLDPDEIEEGEEYPDRLYLDSEWMDDMNQVYVYAKGFNISFKRPGHNLEIHITQKTEVDLTG